MGRGQHFSIGRERFLKQKYEKTSKYFNKRVFCLVFCFLLLFFSEKEKKLKNCFFVFFFRIQVHFYAVFLNGQRSTMYVKYLQFFIIISSLLKAKNYEIFESNLSRLKYSSTLPLCHSNSWLHYIPKKEVNTSLKQLIKFFSLLIVLGILLNFSQNFSSVWAFFRSRQDLIRKAFGTTFGTTLDTTWELVRVPVIF